jgi:hypothetical protein
MKTKPSNTHGGKRKGAGRKSTLEPVFLKRFRATEEEQREFLSLLTGDARQDFILVLEALRGKRVGIC